MCVFCLFSLFSRTRHLAISLVDNFNFTVQDRVLRAKIEFVVVFNRNFSASKMISRIFSKPNYFIRSAKVVISENQTIEPGSSSLASTSSSRDDTPSRFLMFHGLLRKTKA